MNKIESSTQIIDSEKRQSYVHPGAKSGKALYWLIAATLCLTGLWLIHNHLAASSPQAAASTHQGPPPVNVTAGIVTPIDVPIYLDGLGTVQAQNTVTIHSRVDGQLKKLTFVEGQNVRAGDLLAVIDPAPFKAALDQAQAKQGQDQAQLTNAQLDLSRDADLVGKKVIAPQQYDTQKALVSQYAAAVKADEAAVNSAAVQLGYTNIDSPLDGRTGIRSIDEGNIVHAADTNGLVVVTQLQPVSLFFTLPQQNLAEIQQQTKAGEELSVLALDRDNKAMLDEGKLSVIDNQIDTTTGTIRLKATFPNQKLQLWPGEFVNARLHLTTRKGGLTVPASVIQRGPDGAYAFLIKPDRTVEIRPVKVAQIDNGIALLDDGLQPGENVVVDGQYKLQAGSHVKTNDSKNGGGTPSGKYGGNHAK